MTGTTNLSVGDEWPEHYRGLTLHINQNRDCWWQVYNGTDRLYVDAFPEEIIDNLLQLKPLGGRIRLTESGDVLTRLDEDDTAESVDEYAQVWIGNVEFTGELVPEDAPDMAIPVDPTDLSKGDLWPSVYDGARYSFVPNGRMWWKNSTTKKRHPVTTSLPTTIQATLRQQKPQGGSFRITPTNDVITLVESPATETVKRQFGDLPALVRNIIKLRKERADLEMIPMYVGDLGDTTIELESPTSLTDQMSSEEQDALEGWAASLGGTTPTQTADHTTTEEHTQTDSQDTTSDQKGTTPEQTDTTPDNQDTSSPAQEADSDEDGRPDFKDDPEEWLGLDMEATEERIYDGG
jgi:hypothetical protein